MNSKVDDEQNTIVVSHVWLHCCRSTIAANPSNKIISNMQLLHLQLSLFHIYYNIDIIIRKLYTKKLNTYKNHIYIYFSIIIFSNT